MKRTHKVLIAAVAVIGIAVPMATPAFASTPAVSPAATQAVLNGCNSAQLEAAAATAIANWSINETEFGTSAPAGVTVNGTWFPASLLATAPSAASIATCTSVVVPEAVSAFNVATSQSVLTGCVAPAQLQVAATLAITNWGINVATLGVSSPAGVTVNGQWFPGSLLLSGALPASTVSCPQG